VPAPRVASGLLRPSRTMRRETVADSWKVWRAVGPRGLAAATWRRARAHARGIRFGLRALLEPAAAPDDPRFVAALALSPSPFPDLGRDDPLAPLATLGGHAAAGIVARARAALAEPDDALVPSILPAPDPRLAWEPSRGGRLVWLAAGVRAARPGDERVALKLGLEAALRASTCAVTRENPLETALAAWNLWCAVMLAGPASLSQATRRAVAATLCGHARHLVDNLEDRGLVVGSHLVGELTGLYVCGVALRAAGREPAAWRALARGGLAHEAQRQVLADGGGAEGSTGYARFVTELWLAAAAVARAAGERIPGVERAAGAMLDALVEHLAPDGRDVGVGDDDDSRVLPPGARAPRDLLPLAALARQRLVGVSWSEEAAWLLGAEGHRRWLETEPRPWAASCVARSFGIALGRTGGLGGDMVALRAGPHGQSGAGGHAHNDPLAVAVWFDGAPVVIDPGTGAYLGRSAWRERFRGVAAHATVCVDGEEPSPLPATRPFALPDAAGARILAADDTPAQWRCVAEHHGYRRLGVRHRREVMLDRRRATVVIIDALDGGGSHDVAVSFPLATPDHASWLEGDGPGLSWRIDPGLDSPAYGLVRESVVARRVGRVQLPFTTVTRIEKKR
jgi:heparinase II/III-like protein